MNSLYSATLSSLADKYRFAGVSIFSLEETLMRVSLDQTSQNQLARDNLLLEAYLLSNESIGYLTKFKSGEFPNNTISFKFNQDKVELESEE